jgi:hypothetical protein
MVIARYTTLQSLQHFYSQKLFERKLDAYIKVIEALHVLRKESDRELTSLKLFGVERPENALVDAAWQEATTDLGKFADMGILLFSDEAAATIAEVRRAINSVHNSKFVDLFSDMTTIANACKTVLDHLIPMAKRDLKS